MPTVTDWGFVDGMPAKIVRDTRTGKVDLYWGGRGRADGRGHNHAVTSVTNPHATNFLRVNGRIVVDDSNPGNEGRRQRPTAGNMLADSFRRALRMYSWSYNLGGPRKRRRRW